MKGRTLVAGPVLVYVRRVVIGAGAIGAGVVSIGLASLVVTAFHYVHFNREHLPDLGAFTRFDFPTVGRIYDANGQVLLEVAREYRDNVQYSEIPPVVRAALLAAEDKHFFQHDGIDYSTVPRVLTKVRIGALIAAEPASAGGRSRGAPALFPQGGSTITQQLVRGVFLQQQKAQESLAGLRSTRPLFRALAWVIGARNVNIGLRKGEEMRLSLWIERQMRAQFGSKRRAKEEIFARYVSFVYMGSGQYGFARAAEYYAGRPLASFTADDADLAALLAGIMKSPRDYAPTARDPGPILRRRNEILVLMAGRGDLSRAALTRALSRPLPPPAVRAPGPFRSSAVVEHVLEELHRVDLGVADLLDGRIQIHTTVDARAQRLASEALEHGLERYERRHPGARGIVQGSVIVLRNRDGSVLAEAGGRLVYRGRATNYSDFNRVRRAMRQPGSAMKPIVYLAAFQQGGFSLETLVPDEPISVPDGRADARKWIANYDGLFKGPIPVRQALAESRNAVAIWIAQQIGIDAILRTSRSLGMQTRLQRYVVTALGASDVTLLELATAYRTIASGFVAQPHVIRQIVGRTGEAVALEERRQMPIAVAEDVLALIQEGLRGVVRLPTGTAHALNARGFPIAVMGKTGTTNEFRDALFVGSTYGLDGVTAAIRIGFDDNRSLGAGETGSRVALPVFQELLASVYRDGIAGPVPAFPDQMEQRITRYLLAGPAVERAVPAARPPAPAR